MPPPITVSIVEDDERVRESLAVLINGAAGFRCVGHHGSAEEALKFIPAEHPQVVLMDINLPKMSGIECVSKLKAKLSSVQIVMLSIYEDSEQIFRALAEGATGYIVKRTPPAKLLEAIQDAAGGGSPMSSPIARKVVQYFHRAGPGQREGDNLSKRERETLELLAKGYLYKEIAEALSIGVETVRSHLRSI